MSVAALRVSEARPLLWPGVTVLCASDGATWIPLAGVPDDWWSRPVSGDPVAGSPVEAARRRRQALAANMAGVLVGCATLAGVEPLDDAEHGPPMLVPVGAHGRWAIAWGGARRLFAATSGPGVIEVPGLSGAEIVQRQLVGAATVGAVTNRAAALAAIARRLCSR